jgi:hypothetical protein
MVCYQVLARFAARRHKAVLVSTHIKKQEAPAFLVLSRLPFGSGLTYRRFFKTKKEAARNVSYLRSIYKSRGIHPAHSGGQLSLF